MSKIPPDTHALGQDAGIAAKSDERRLRKSTLARTSAAWPAITLFFLAPALAELLSGSSPPKEYFAFPGFVFLHLSYGALAVLLREWAVRHRLGAWAKLVLALAVGIYIEGIVCKTFFSPEWPDFSFAAGYGRLYGVNWPWTLNLLVYHGLNSFLLPWLIVDLLFPRHKDQPALGSKSMAWLGFGVLATGVLGEVALPMNKAGVVYHPGLAAVAFCWSALVLIPLLAANTREPQPASGKPPHAYLAGWLAGLGWLGFMVLQSAGGSLKLGAPWAIFATMIYIALACSCAWRWRGRLLETHQFALVAGTIWFWAILAVFQELDNPQRPDDTSGMGVLGGLAILGLFVLRQYLVSRRRTLTIRGSNAIIKSQ
jgi:hypothetical protein